MPERGGPANQSGTRYQNVIAAEWFARMLNKDNNIETIRVESPVSVDDILIKFFGKKTIYQQVKERAPKGGQWTVNKMREIWIQFKKQYETDPGCIIQFVSCSSADILREICIKAKYSPNLSDFKHRLNQKEEIAFKGIMDLITWPEQPTYIFLKNVEFKTPHLQEHDIENLVISAYMDHIKQPKLAFKILIDLASLASSRREQLDANNVIDYLKDNGISDASFKNITSKEITEIKDRIEEIEDAISKGGGKKEELITGKSVMRGIPIIPSKEPLESEINRVVEEAKLSRDIQGFEETQKTIYEKNFPLGNGRTVKYVNEQTTKTSIEVFKDIEQPEFKPKLEKLSEKIPIPKDLTSEEILSVKIISYFDGIHKGLLKCILQITHSQTKIYEKLLKKEIIFTEKKEIQIPEKVIIEKVFVYDKVKKAFPLTIDEQNKHFPEILINAIDKCKDNKVFAFLAIDEKYNEFNVKQKHIIRNKIINKKNDYMTLWTGSRILLEDKEIFTLSDFVLKLSEENKYTNRIYYNFSQAYLKLILKDGEISLKTKIDKNVLNKVKIFINKALAEDPKNSNYLACLAIINVLEKDYTHSIQNASKALKIDENNINALNSLGISYFKKGKYNKSLENFKIIYNIYPDDIHNLSNIGEMYRAQNLFKEAIEPLEEALEIDSNNDKIYAALGVIYYNLKDYNEANNYLDKALKINSKCELALFGKADIYKNIDTNLPNAIKYYNRGLNLNPSNFKAWIALAESYLLHGKLKEAKQIYSKLTKENPDDEDVQIGLGGYHANHGDIENTYLWCNKIIQRNPNNDKAWYCIGIAYNNSKRFKESIEYFDKAIEINPLNDEFLFAKGSALFALNDLEQAKILLNDAIEINPTNSKAYITLAKIENNLKSYKRALKFCERAKEIIFPQEKFKLRIDLLFISGIISANLEQYNDAINSFKALLKLDPNNIEALNNLGKIYGTIGNFKKAKITFLKIQKINPTDVEVKKNLGFVYFNLKQFNKSIALFESEYKSFIEDFNVNYILASSYSNIKDFNNAIGKYKKAYEIDTKNIPNLINLGLCHMHLGNHKKAIEKFRQILKLDPKNIEARLLLSEAYLISGQKTKSINSIKQVIKNTSKDSSIYFRIGMIYKNNSDFKNAIKYFEKSNQLIQSKETWMELGMSYNSINKHKKAIDSYTHILKKFEKDSITLGNLGASYAFINNKTKAIKYLKKSLEFNEKNILSWTNLSVLYFDDKDYNKAIECLKSAHEIDTKDFDILARIGDIYNNQLYDMNNAILSYKKAVKLTPKNVKIIFALANCYNNIQNYTEAIKWHKKALKIDPENVNIMAWLAICYVFIRKNKLAKKWLDKAINLDPDNYHVILGFSIYYNNTRKIKESIEWGKKGLKCDPTNKQNYILLTIIGNSYNELKHYSKSIEFFEKAKKLNSSDINILSLGGLAYSNINQYEKTIEYWEEYLEYIPDDWEYWGYLGATYMKTNKFDKAIKCFKKVIALKPEEIRAYYSIGDAYKKSQNISKAIGVYKNLKNLDERNEPWLHIGDIYFNILKDFKKAIKEYSEAMKINPNNWKAWKNLGISYDNIGKNKKALECFEKGLGIKKNNIELLYLKEESLIKVRKYEEAIKFSDYIIKIEPDSPIGLYYKSMVYSLTNELDKSLEFLKKAIKINNGLIFEVIKEKNFENLKSTMEFEEYVKDCAIQKK